MKTAVQSSITSIEELRPSKNLSPILSLFKYLAPYKYYLICMIIALIITSSSVLILSQSASYVIDYGISKSDGHMLNQSILFFILVSLVLSIATAIRFFLITMVGELVIRDIREDIYKQILRLSPHFYESNKSGEILSRLTTDTTLLQTIIGSSLSMAMRNTVMFVGSMIMLFISSLKLTMMIAIVIPLIVFPIVFLGRKMRKFSKISQDRVADLSATSEETIGFIKAIQAYTRERYQIDAFKAQLQEVIKTATGRITARAILVAIAMILAFGAIGFILWVGGHDVVEGVISPGKLSSFIFLSIICAATMTSLAEVSGDLHKAAGASERIAEFLSIHPDISNATDAIDLSAHRSGEIEFKNVTFFYPAKQNHAALENVSFKVNAGKTFALVGESGSGKTTILQLLLRFYDINHGKILIDGMSTKKVTLESLRDQFAYVGQDPVIFSTTVYDNIAYGRDNATFAEIIEAAKAAAALDFIEKLPNKFDTFLGEKGVRLSGGQKQRLSIARAILRNPKILLLDEATSALDSRNERVVQSALDVLMKNRTTIVVAHRISTIINADTILVLKDGKIIESGSHNELLQRKGEYQKIASMAMLKDDAS